MKSSSKLLSYLAFFIFIFSSCKMDLITKPTQEPDVVLNASDYDDEISAPINLTATQGGCKEIVLSWELLPNAVQYKVFSADTPFDTFIQIAETSDNSKTITIPEKSGTTKYYSIKAVNYYGTVSSPSNIVLGSTLSTPLITSVESTQNGTTSTVSWWMDNCNSTTYQKEVNFIITCYEQDKSTVFATQNAAGAQRSVTFTDQKPHTNYYYQVEAFLSSNQELIEASDMIDAETARRLIPKAAVDFTASQGISKDSITLTWKLPEYADYSLGNNSFEQHPVYFTVERKIENSPDSDYVKIISYIGSVLIDSNENSDSQINFNCETLSSTSENLKIDTTSAEKPNALYPNYTPGTLLSYTDIIDTTEQKYTYRIQSYVDDTTKKISSDEAISTTTGWLISDINFSCKGAYTYRETNETEISNVKVSFSSSMETYGTEYTFIITEQFTPFETNDKRHPTPDSEVIIYTNDSLEKINSLEKVFDCSSELKEGNYKYRIYVTKKGSISFENSYTSTIAIGSISVAKSVDNLPKIAWFEVQDGFNDKFILSWDYHEDYSYELSWELNTNGITDKPENPTPLTNFSVSEDKKTATYIFSTTPDTYGTFELTGIPLSGNVEHKSLENTCYTLGVASPTINSFYYDKIVVSWSAVQKAKLSPTDFKISAYYSDDTNKTDLTNSENTKIEKNGNVFTCTISNPDGYNDILFSGKPVTLSVTSKSATSEDETTGITTVRTLGPASLNTKINKGNETNCTNSDQISVMWNEFEGIDNYYIYRTKYSYNDFDLIERTDSYIISKNNENQISIKVNGEDFNDSTRIEITYDSSKKSFILTDKYKEPEDKTSAFQVNQSQISWGIPFGYVVLPVISENDVEFEQNVLTMSSSSKVNFSSVKDVKGATYGYGINLTAEKSVDGKLQRISWSKPFDCNQSPVLYRKGYETGDSWTKVTNANLSKDDVSAVFSIDKNDIDKPFDYLITYSSSLTTLPSSFDENLTNHKDSISSEEPLNKGYLLAVNLEARPGYEDGDKSISKYYREYISWNEWDYSKRKIGPKTATVYLLNKNFADGWKELVTLDSKCAYDSKGSTLEDVKIEPENYTMNISPASISNGTSTLTNGDLKVLRDTKHYYKITLKTDSGNSVSIGDDESIFTYRQITEQELCRCVSLIIADALTQSGISSGGERTCQGKSGTFTITHPGATQKVIWGFTNSYKHIFRSGLSSKDTKEFVSDFNLSSSITDEYKYSADGSKLYYLPDLSITVSFDGPDSLETYNGTVSFSAGKQGAFLKLETVWNLSINSSVISINNDKTKFLTYFPFDLSEEHDTKYTTSTPSLPIYQSPWWY